MSFRMKPVRERRSISHNTCTASPGAKWCSESEQRTMSNERSGIGTARASQIVKVSPGDETERDIATARGQIEDLERVAAGEVTEQLWQVTQHGRNAAGETIDGADVPQIGRELSRIMSRLIEELLDLPPAHHPLFLRRG